MLPEWAPKGSQGHLMICRAVRTLGMRVCQAHDPCWLEPMAMLPEAERAMGRLALRMIRAVSYDEAQAIGEAELAQWVPYRYGPRHQTTEETS
jgi:hypothetical protein